MSLSRQNKFYVILATASLVTIPYLLTEYLRTSRTVSENSAAMYANIQVAGPNEDCIIINMSKLDTPTNTAMVEFVCLPGKYVKAVIADGQPISIKTFDYLQVVVLSIWIFGMMCFAYGWLSVNVNKYKENRLEFYSAKNLLGLCVDDYRKVLSNNVFQTGVFIFVGVVLGFIVGNLTLHF